MKKIFILALGCFTFLTACKSTNLNTHSISGQNININNSLPENADIQNFIAPYSSHINQDLSKVLAYNPYDLVKIDTDLNTPIGNLIAKIAFTQASFVYNKLTGSNPDFALLNWGGIRSDIPKGNVTTQTAYQIMPFENRLVVVEITGKKVLKMADYLIKNKKPHPLSENVTLHIDKNDQIITFKINGKDIDPSKIYKVVTIDYLANGGDKMYFYQNPISYTDLDYKFRPAIIDYLAKVGTINTRADNRFKKFN